jgi:hypothetical protein
MVPIPSSSQLHTASVYHGTVTDGLDAIAVMADNIVDLTAKAYEITRMIPHGHVTSYGGFTRRWVAPGPA